MDFDSSKAFYEALGFKKLLDGDVAIFGVGAGAFILQRYYRKEWAENCMMQMMVDDLDAWWEHIEALDLPKIFGVQPPKAPAMQPWGLRAENPTRSLYKKFGFSMHFVAIGSESTSDHVAVFLIRLAFVPELLLRG